jgi:hypothetical protein
MFEACFQEWIMGLADAAWGICSDFDGKAVRGGGA